MQPIFIFRNTLAKMHPFIKSFVSVFQVISYILSSYTAHASYPSNN